MANTWLENSEIVFGLLLDGRISRTLANPEIFHPPYNEGVELLKTGLAVEELITKVGIDSIRSAHEAAKSLNGLGDKDWISILQVSYANHVAATKLEQMSKKLYRGQEVQWSELNSIAQKAQEAMIGSFVPLSEIEPEEIKFIPTGWQAWDEHVVGLPEVGMVLIGGNPGEGKTDLMVRLTSAFAEAHPDRNVVVFSIEMILKEIAGRYRQREELSSEAQARILLDESPVSADQVISKASTVENLGLVAIDFLDLMLKSEKSEGALSTIYRTLMLGAKELHCPILILTQLNKYVKGVPTTDDLPYTKDAWALPWMVATIYNPSKDWGNDEASIKLPYGQNIAYIAFWKIRGGFKLHPDDSPGAIKIPYMSKHGWGKKNSKWYSLLK